MARTTNDLLELPERPESSPTEFLIDQRYKELGCYDWNWGKFLRLARALNETDRELGKRLGLSGGELSRRRASGKFTRSEGILLTLIYRFIEYVNTGEQPSGELFASTQTGVAKEVEGK